MIFLQDLCPLPKDGLQSGLQLQNNCGQAKAAETEVIDVWLFGPAFDRLACCQLSTTQARRMLLLIKEKKHRGFIVKSFYSPALVTKCFPGVALPEGKKSI